MADAWIFVEWKKDPLYQYNVTADGVDSEPLTGSVTLGKLSFLCVYQLLQQKMGTTVPAS